METTIEARREAGLLVEREIPRSNFMFHFGNRAVAKKNGG
jgi:hypothetical protein